MAIRSRYCVSNLDNSSEAVREWPLMASLNSLGMSPRTLYLIACGKNTRSSEGQRSINLAIPSCPIS